MNVNISETFWEQILPSRRTADENYFSLQLTPKAQKESQQSSQLKKFTTFPEANNMQTGGQETTFTDELSYN